MESLLMTTEELESIGVYFDNRPSDTWILREEHAGRVRFKCTGPGALFGGEWTDWLDPSAAPFHFYLADETPRVQQWTS